MLPIRNPAVLCQAVAEGGILLHTERELYFGLNVAGAQIWELRPPQCSNLTELCTELRRRYAGAEAEAVRNDVKELLNALASQELLQAASSE